MKHLIGITGLKRSGKDTAAKAFLNHGYIQIGLSDPIKDMIAALLRCRGMPDEIIPRYVEGDLKDMPTTWLMGKSPREVMQTLGTEWGRDLVHADLWMDTFITRVEMSSSSVVITGIRFQNEIDAIHNLGGQVYRVERTGVTATEHTSEKTIMDFKVDGVLKNIYQFPEDFTLSVERQFF